MSVRETLDNIRDAPDPPNEETAKLQILVPILMQLGWDLSRQEVLFEHLVADGGRIDIALKGTGRIVALIEAKGPKVDLHPHVGQVVRYAFHEGVDICVLTNGLEWWLYRPMERVPFEERRFAVLRTREDPVARLAGDLQTFLGKQDLLSGRADRQARIRLQEQREAALLESEIPNVWKQMLTRPDDELVDLVKRRVYEKVSLRPVAEQVTAVLRGSLVPVAWPDQSGSVAKPTSGGGKPTGVRLWGEKYDFRRWEDGIPVLRRIGNVLYRLHGSDFEKRVLAHRTSTGNPIASRNPKSLRSPIRVASSDVYLETDLNASQMLSRAVFLLKFYDQDSSDLEIIYG